MRLRKIKSVLPALLLSSLVSCPALASGRTAHVHKGPGPAWEKSFEVPSGAHVKVGSCKAGWGHHDWCKVTYRGKTGFIHEGALKPSGKHAIVAPVITTEAVKLHKAAASSSSIVTELRDGEQVNVAHCSEGWLKGWCRVNHEGHTGYVKGASLRHD